MKYFLEATIVPVITGLVVAFTIWNTRRVALKEGFLQGHCVGVQWALEVAIQYVKGQGYDTKKLEGMLSDVRAIEKDLIR